MSADTTLGTIALASGNVHKAHEWQALLPGWRVETLDMREAPAETGLTFAENALAKARFGATIAPAACWVLGEDSGLAVEALSGAPGIRSARFAGEAASDADNVGLLLEEMLGASDRSARFLCAAACLSPEGPNAPGERTELQVDGVLEGEIATAPRGGAGFGYDPVFVPAGEVRTLAELGDGWKRASSHRARAATQLLELLDRWYRAGVDAEALLSDLLEVSGQVEAAAIVTRAGAPVATTLSGDQATALAETVHQLSTSANAVASPTDEHLVQLQITLEENCVFLAQDGENVVGCLTVSHPTAGLVFYDLKTTLRRLAGEHEELVPKPRAWDGAEETPEEGSA